MRHRKKKLTLDRTSSQRSRLLRGLALELIKHERITTTAARARATRSIVEKLITRGKKDTLHNRRMLIKALNEPVAAQKILEKLGPRFATRPGGYVRLIKLDRRQGDGAEQMIVEILPA